MKKIYDAVATIGKYTDKKDGTEKKRYLTVGTVFEDDQGRMSLKLDGVPVSPEWSGWISFYEPKQYDHQRGESMRNPPAQSQHNIAKQNAYQPEQGQHVDDDIPF